MAWTVRWFEMLKTASITENQTADLEGRFVELAQRWQRETAMHSVLQKKVLHPSYQRIIGFGPAVVPLILRELRRGPAHWFWALNAITGEDPAPPHSNFDQAREAWLNWGKERGYI